MHPWIDRLHVRHIRTCARARRMYPWNMTGSIVAFEAGPEFVHRNRYSSIGSTLEIERYTDTCTEVNERIGMLTRLLWQVIVWKSKVVIGKGTNQLLGGKDSSRA